MKTSEFAQIGAIAFYVKAMPSEYALLGGAILTFIAIALCLFKD